MWNNVHCCHLLTFFQIHLMYKNSRSFNWPTSLYFIIHFFVCDVITTVPVWLRAEKKTRNFDRVGQHPYCDVMSLLTRRVSRQALSHSCTTLTASNQLLFKWFDKTSIVKVFSFTTFLKLWMYLKFKTQTLTNMSWIRMRMIPHLPHVFEIFTSLQIFAALVKLNRWNMLFCYIFFVFLSASFKYQNIKTHFNLSHNQLIHSCIFSGPYYTTWTRIPTHRIKEPF